MYRKNTAGQFVYFCLINASSGTALTGATVTAYRALDNGSQATATGTTTELANGQYRFNLSQADTNANYGSYLFTASGAVPVEKTVVFTAANPQDAAAFGLSTINLIDNNVDAVNSVVNSLDLRLPATLVGGRMDASVGAMANNVITSSVIATHAITASAIQANAITDQTLAASAITEIQSGLATSAQATAIETDTQNIQSRIPTALVGGRMDASVGAMAANTLTASALATDAVNEIVGAIYGELLDGGSAGTMMEVFNNLDWLRSQLASMIESDGAGQFRFDTIALEQAPAGGSANITVEDISITVS